MSAEMVKLSDNISAIVEENTAATEQMSVTAKTVSKSIEEVAGVAEENSAATEQVSAAAHEVDSQIQHVVQSGNNLTKVADEFKQIVAKYKLSEEQQ
jgi:methyl-accepting chemotaxis protein